MDRCSLEKPAVTRGKVRELTAAAPAFLWDPRSRLTVMPELVSDGLVCYEPAVARSFGGAIDYAVLVKTPSRKGKRDTGVPFVQKRSVVGAPDMDRVSTSYVERHNSTIRDGLRRSGRRGERGQYQRLETWSPTR